MPSTITVALDEQGKVSVGDLPPGVFHSRFATPPDAQIRDVISINAADLYTVVINAPSVTDATAAPPVTLVSSTPTQAVFAVDAGQLPEAQDFGMVLCQAGAVAFSLGVIVNPESVPLPLVIDASGIIVNPDDVPIGVHCDPVKQKVAVWAGGGYVFAFALPDGSDLRFERVEFIPDSELLSASISADKLTVWLINDNLITHSGFAVDVLFHCSSIEANGRAVLDPTIVNNPINQGGGDGTSDTPWPRYDMAAASAH